MKQLAMLITTGVLSLVLTACGGEEQPKKDEVRTEAGMTQEQGNEHTKPVEKRDLEEMKKQDTAEPMHEQAVEPMHEKKAADEEQAAE